MDYSAYWDDRNNEAFAPDFDEAFEVQEVEEVLEVEACGIVEEVVPEMPWSVRWLYEEQWPATYWDPAVDAPCWEQLYEEDDPELICLCFEEIEA